jgi:hypothetical protein
MVPAVNLSLVLFFLHLVNVNHADFAAMNCAQKVEHNFLQLFYLFWRLSRQTLTPAVQH